ncbi:SH3 domain protein [Candidatus Magnetomoraceae bacterium gMMP-15]
MNLKSIICISFIIIFCGSVIHAENWYVKERMKITVRRGPDVSYKVLAVISSGRKVNRLESTENWTKIRVQSGVEGWVLNRYLTKNEPDGDILARLKVAHNKLTARAKSLSEENSSLKKKNKRLNAELSQKTESYDKIIHNYEKLKKDAAGFLALEKKYKKMTAQIKKLNDMLAASEFEREMLLRKQGFWGAGIGLGILFIGFMFGMYMNRKKREGKLF